MRRRLSPAAQWLLFGCLLLTLVFPMLRSKGVPELTASVKTATTPQEFIKKLAPEAQRLGKAYGMKPSLLLAQASLESQYGQRLLAAKYRNLYQLPGQDKREAVLFLVTETVDGKEEQKARYYQIYPTWERAMADYLFRLKAGGVGSKTLYERLATAKTVEDASQIFLLEGYTENTDYGPQLMEIIEEHQLEQYDKD